MSPSAGAHVPHKKCLGHLCPSSPEILGTPLKSARFHIPEGGGGKFPLPPGRPCHHQEMPWLLVPLWFKPPGYATAVKTFFVFLRGGQAPIVAPSAGTHVPYQKCLGHLCPSSPKILGTPLKSAHVFIFQRGGLGASAPCPPPTGAHVPHQEMPWPLVPHWFKTPGYATAVNIFFVFLRGGQAPFAPPPPLAPMSPTRNAWVTCAHLVQTSWVRH